jgi:hypothetical protein
MPVTHDHHYEADVMIMRVGRHRQQPRGQPLLAALLLLGSHARVCSRLYSRLWPPSQPARWHRVWLSVRAVVLVFFLRGLTCRCMVVANAAAGN